MINIRVFVSIKIIGTTLHHLEFAKSCAIPSPTRK